MCRPPPSVPPVPFFPGSPSLPLQVPRTQTPESKTPKTKIAKAKFAQAKGAIAQFAMDKCPTAKLVKAALANTK